MKTQGFRDPEYKSWVSSLPCVICNPDVMLRPWEHIRAPGFSDPDHLPTLGERGISMKVPDYFLIPLDRPCHIIRGLHFRRSQTVLTPQQCEERGIPQRFANRNLWEIALRILWGFLHPPPSMATWAI